MRKIDLTPYDTGFIADSEPVMFEVQKRLTEVLFVKPANGREILLRDKLAVKIEAWPDNDLLVEESEYALLTAGLDACQFNNRGFVEFARRVIEAPSVDVKAK